MSILKDELLVNLAGQNHKFGTQHSHLGIQRILKKVYIACGANLRVVLVYLGGIPVPEAVARMPANDSNVSGLGVPYSYNKFSIVTYLERDYVNPNLY